MYLLIQTGISYTSICLPATYWYKLVYHRSPSVRKDPSYSTRVQSQSLGPGSSYWPERNRCRTGTWRHRCRHGNEDFEQPRADNVYRWRLPLLYRNTSLRWHYPNNERNLQVKYHLGLCIMIKPTKSHVNPATCKIQISLRIRAVWLEG